MKYLAFGLCMAWATLTGHVASASLIGDEVQVQFLHGSDVISDNTVEVTGAIIIRDELDFGDMGRGTTEIIIDDEGVRFNIVAARETIDAGALEIHFLDLDWLPDPGRITHATLSARNATGATPVPDMSLAFTHDSLILTSTDFYIPYTGDLRDATMIFEIGIEVTHAVPEPATVALMSLGLAGIAFRARRRAS